MKPSWNDAPEWANWLAMDEGGDWFWYEQKPYWNQIRRSWVDSNSGRIASAYISFDADKSLDPRP